MKEGSSVTAARSWQELYAAAMLELDLGHLPARIKSAQAAIRQALKELASSPDCNIAEMQEMSSALGNLQALQRVELNGSKRAEPGPSSDRGGAYATLVPEDNCAKLAQAAVRDEGTTSLRESRDRSKTNGTPASQGCDA